MRVGTRTHTHSQGISLVIIFAILGATAYFGGVVDGLQNGGQAAEPKSPGECTIIYTCSPRSAWCSVGDVM